MNTGTWGTTGNTCLITDPGISPNSIVHAQVNSASVQAAGNWSYTYAAGTCTITSSDGESSTLPIIYYVD